MFQLFKHFLNANNDSGLDTEELANRELNPFIEMQSTISASDANNKSINNFLEYIGEKPGGTDVGHLVNIDGKPVIIKTGITLSLLGQSFVEYYNERDKKLAEYSKERAEYISKLTEIDAKAGQENYDAESERKKLKPNEEMTEEQIFRKKPHTWLGYIASGFIKVIKDQSKTTDEWSAEEKALKVKLTNAFDQFLTTSAANELAQKVNANPADKKTYKCNVDDVTAIYKSFVIKADGSIDQDIVNAISFPLFADLINGSFSQQINNMFQETFGGPIAEQRLLALQKDAPCLLMASNLLENVTGFDSFLVEPFINNERKNFNSDAEWLSASKKELDSKFDGKNIDNLLQMVLFRFVFGESADLGPDNMLISRSGTNWNISNIDLTGFRYDRAKNFDIRDKAGKIVETKFGWQHILTDRSAIVDNLLSPAVLSQRFVEDNAIVGKKAKDSKYKEVYSTIVDVLKQKIGDEQSVQNSVDAFVAWGASQDATKLNAQMEQAIDFTYVGLSELFKFDQAFLPKLKSFNAKFLTSFADYAQNQVNKMEVDATNGASASAPKLKA